MTLTASSGSGGSAALGFVFIILGLIAYWTPLLVAWIRHVPHIGSVAVVNGFLGWTLIGWVVALAMACRSRAHPSVAVATAVVQQFPPGPPPDRGYGAS